MRRFLNIAAVVTCIVSIQICIVGIFIISSPESESAHQPCPIWRISNDPADRAFSILNNSRVTLMPSKVSFAVPQRWLDHYLGQEGNLALSPGQIESVANGTVGGLEFEFASVTNAVFPFDRCAASFEALTKPVFCPFYPGFPEVLSGSLRKLVVEYRRGQLVESL